MNNAGEKFKLTKETLLRELSNSKGKYRTDKIRYVSDGLDGDRYVVIALKWKWENRIYPRLAIRWFHGDYGFPHNGENASWFIIPAAFNEYVLKMVGEKGVNCNKIENIRAFLAEKPAILR
ncbi:hypothetical protein [uncultured Fibrobacter sp.]|uniref:hypothetical protein n=1 Tax=uncultured Fibrobacter sp. TaxID=261512 RepID=UPI0025FDEE7E|nr:hypothetical protein [uncultured Fibrobacter sp.]